MHELNLRPDAQKIELSYMRDACQLAVFQFFAQLAIVALWRFSVGHMTNIKVFRSHLASIMCFNVLVHSEAVVTL